MFLIKAEIFVLLLLETGSGEKEACMKKKKNINMEQSNKTKKKELKGLCVCCHGLKMITLY